MGKGEFTLIQISGMTSFLNFLQKFSLELILSPLMILTSQKPQALLKVNMKIPFALSTKNCCLCVAYLLFHSLPPNCDTYLFSGHSLGMIVSTSYASSGSSLSEWASLFAEMCVGVRLLIAGSPAEAGLTLRVVVVE